MNTEGEVIQQCTAGAGEGQAMLLESQFCSASFLGELHHLFWIPPFVNRGKLDLGWSCREHALVTAALVGLRGLRAVIVHGRAAFVRGSEDCPTGIDVSPHTWAVIDGLGSCDLSIRPTPAADGKPWLDHSYVFGGRLHGSGTTSFASLGSESQFEAAYNAATHLKDGVWGGYCRIQNEMVTKETIGRALTWCNSPQSVRLKKRFIGRPDIYAKAILHLYEFQLGKQPTLTDLHPMMAWKRIAERKGDASEQLVEMLFPGARP